MVDTSATSVLYDDHSFVPFHDVAEERVRRCSFACVASTSMDLLVVRNLGVEKGEKGGLLLRQHLLDVEIFLSSEVGRNSVAAVGPRLVAVPAGGS